MNKNQLINRLKTQGINQLRKGETARDALDYLSGQPRERKGYEFKKRDGTLMDRNQIIAASNKEALAKTVKKPTPSTSAFCGCEIKDIHPEDLGGIEDHREDKTKIGEIEPCHYCNEPLRVDKAGYYDILNCEQCSSFAVFVNCI